MLCMSSQTNTICIYILQVKAANQFTGQCAILSGANKRGSIILNGASAKEFSIVDHDVSLDASPEEVSMVDRCVHKNAGDLQ